MKNLTICLVLFLLSSLVSTTLNAAVAHSFPTDSTQSIQSAQADLLIARLNEIKSMDKTTLDFSEKRKLRKEARSIKAQLKEVGGGVYISAGALLVAILLIVLLL